MIFQIFLFTFFTVKKVDKESAPPRKVFILVHFGFLNELQNSRVFDLFRHAEILFPKYPHARGTFQRGLCKSPVITELR